MLQSIADVPCYYKVCTESVTVGTNTYNTTICALHLGPQGACKGIALKSGPHPYICHSCEALQHGKSSQLLHKLARASKLKYPRTVQNRATQRGISHKQCSKEHIELALQEKTSKHKVQSKK